MSGDTNPTARFKLVPTPEDRAIFHLIIEGGLGALRTKHPEMFFQHGKGSNVSQRWRQNSRR